MKVTLNFRNFLIFVAIVIFVQSPAAGQNVLQLPPPSYPTAVSLLESEQPTEALATLDRQLKDLNGDPLPVEAEALRAALLIQVGRYQEGEATWRSIMTKEDSLKIFAQKEIVSSLVGRGAATQAEENLTNLIDETSIGQQLDLILAVANSYLHAKKPDGAAKLYAWVLKSQLHGSSADSARLGLASSKELGGNLEEAIKIYRETQIEHRTPEAFTAAYSSERRLTRLLGRTPKRFSEDHYRILSRRLRNLSRYELAKDLLEEWRQVYPETDKSDIIETEIIDTLYNMRSNEEASVRCEQFTKFFPRSALLAQVSLIQFRLDVRMGLTTEAKLHGHDLWQGQVRGATSRQRRSAGVLLAAYLVSVGEVEAGLDIYRELFRTSGTPSDQRDILWRAGIAALRANQNQRAVINLRSLNRRNPTGDLAPAGLYWLSIAEYRIGRQTEAQQLLRRLVQRYPYHYYGIRAQDRLLSMVIGSEFQGNYASSSRQFPALELSDSIRNQTDFKAATFLAKAGFKTEAAERTRRLLDNNRQNGATALLAVRASAEAGDYRSVSRLLVNHFGQYLQSPATNLPEDFWSLVYPRPFWKEIQESASTHGVDPLLLLSLMRQESRFDPQARSAVGAVGLFQIMPYTANELASQAGLNQSNDGDQPIKLTEPSINTAIAATLLSNLQADFGNFLPPIIASYNAGEERTSVWWNAGKALPDDLFIDSIPYTETRRFVREVLTNYFSYHRLYSTVQ